MADRHVIGVFIASAEGAVPQPVPSVRAVPGKGLEGDRYFNEIGTFVKSGKKAGGPVRVDSQATLIEIEALEALEREYAIRMEAGASRRNIVTRGVALNHLVGKEFTVGGVRMKGIKLCEPCGHLESLTLSGVKKGLIHRGGLRAQILTEGIIHVGDSIIAAPQEASAACA